jgi:hypothetical protein
MHTHTLARTHTCTHTRWRVQVAQQEWKEGFRIEDLEFSFGFRV